tara:strand:+ start:5419 stop:6306 length:888 start_codon:yes stop_codon:yes gene_type:complete
MPSGGGSGGGSTNTVQKADPWAGQQPFLIGGQSNEQTVPGVMPEAANLYQNNPLQFYPNQTFAPLSSETESALQAQTTRATDGSPVTGAMNDELSKTLSGGYLDANTNPYLMPMADNIRAQVQPAIDARFGASGRSQSGLGARAVSQGVTDALATQAYNNYNNERTNQMRAMMFAPQAAANDYQDIAKLQEVGNVREDFNQQQINDQMQRFQFANMEPYQRLGLYNQLIQGNYGGQTQTNQTAPRRSVGSNVLGGGIAGAGLGYLAGNSGALGLTGGQGALAGAGAGGLLGGLAL